VSFALDEQIACGSFATHSYDAVVALPTPSACALWIGEAPELSCAQTIYHKYVELHAGLARFLPLVTASTWLHTPARRPDDAVLDAVLQIAGSLDSGRVQADELYMRFLLEQLASKALTDVACMSIVQHRYNATMVVLSQMLEEHAQTRGNVMVLDLSDAAINIPASLLLLHLRSDASVLLSLQQSAEDARLRIDVHENTPANAVHIGELMRAYGGDGAKHKGWCTIPAAQREELLDKILCALNA
jgi:hypothetical protein